MAVVANAVGLLQGHFTVSVYIMPRERCAARAVCRTYCMLCGLYAIRRPNGMLHGRYTAQTICCADVCCVTVCSANATMHERYAARTVCRAYGIVCHAYGMPRGRYAMRTVCRVDGMPCGRYATWTVRRADGMPHGRYAAQTVCCANSMSRGWYAALRGHCSANPGRSGKFRKIWQNPIIEKKTHLARQKSGKPNFSKKSYPVC